MPFLHPRISAEARGDMLPPDWPDLIARARLGGLSVDEIAKLASRLAASGERLPATKRRSADLASTGGPTSLSTLLCPPMLAATGWSVPKLGVPGRPAGGVDVLAGISGYRVDLDTCMASAVLERYGYVHLDAGSTFAPDDAALFRYRQSIGAQSVPDLAIASLLSKKLAMSVRRVGLEVRVAPHGNFGADRVAAHSAAERFVAVADLLGISAVCILTDATRPFQPYVGRGEALLAIQLLIDNDDNEWLGEHFRNCAAMAAAVGGSIADSVSRATFGDAFCANVEAQGGSLTAMRRRADEVASSHVWELIAPSSGRVAYDLERVRAAVTAAQGFSANGWPDGAGVVFHVRTGTRVKRGALLLTARCSQEDWPALRDALSAAVLIGDYDEAPGGAIMEVVGV